MNQYLRNLSLWARGIRWLWTRQLAPPVPHIDLPRGIATPDMTITYKPGWGPWKFLPVYLTTYFLACLLGHGITSLSAVWYQRSQVYRIYDCTYFPEDGGLYQIARRNGKAAYPVARFMTRLLNGLVPGKHGQRVYQGRLWGSVSVRD